MLGEQGVVKGEKWFWAQDGIASHISLCHSSMAESQGAQENIPLWISGSNGDSYWSSYLCIINIILIHQIQEL